MINIQGVIDRDNEEIKLEQYITDSFLSNMYLIYTKRSLSEGKAIIIDPHISEELVEKLAILSVNDIQMILTHEHFDHTTGVNYIREHFQTNLYCQEYCGERIKLKRNNRPLSIMSPDSDAQRYLGADVYECFADATFDESGSLSWCGIDINFLHTPGHTEGSCCMEIGNVVFTGDYMIKDTPVITRFRSGSETEYTEKTLPYLLSFKEDTIIAPGHGVVYRKSEVIEKDGCFISVK